MSLSFYKVLAATRTLPQCQESNNIQEGARVLLNVRLLYTTTQNRIITAVTVCLGHTALMYSPHAAIISKKQPTNIVCSSVYTINYSAE